MLDLPALGPGWAHFFGVMMLEGLGESSVAFLLLGTDADGLAWGSSRLLLPRCHFRGLWKEVGDRAGMK